MGLFSTHYHTSKHTSRTELVPYAKTVTHKRAPTDESIALFDEYLEKAKDRILSVYKLELNSFEVLVVSFHDEATMSMEAESSIKYFMRYKINGETIESKFRLDPFEVMELKSRGPGYADGNILKMVIEQVSKELAKYLVKNVKTTSLGLTKDYNLK